MKTKELLKEIASLPVEDRALVADAVLRSLNPIESDIEKKWRSRRTTSGRTPFRRRKGNVGTGSFRRNMGEIFAVKYSFHLEAQAEFYQASDPIVAVMHLHRDPKYRKASC